MNAPNRTSPPWVAIIVTAGCAVTIIAGAWVAFAS